MNWKKFILWEAASRDTIDVKRCYIDVVKDLIAGILLSQIIYWFLPGKNGRPRVTIEKQGRYWLAKKREDWWDECRITPKQFDRAVGILEEAGIVTSKVFKFGPETVKHISINWEVFLGRLEHVLNEFIASEESKAVPSVTDPEFPKCKIRTSPDSKSEIPQRGNPLDTKTPAQNTSEISSSPLPPPANKTEEAANVKLPKPFDSLSSEDIAEAFYLCSQKGLNPHDQVDALVLEYAETQKAISNPRNLLFTILRVNHGVSSASLAKLFKHRKNQAELKEKGRALAIEKDRRHQADEERLAKARDHFQSLTDEDKATLEERTKGKLPLWQHSYKTVVEMCMIANLADEMGL